MKVKVLVISHNCFSTFQNMGKTLKGLFGSFEKEQICQLYLYPSFPNVDVCNSYFRITDEEVLKSIFHRTNCGQIIDKNEINEDNSLFDDEQLSAKYQKGRRKKSYMMIARNLIWKIGKWKTDGLMQWIKNENPDIIFYASGDFCFSHNIALTISKKLNIPLVTYFCDDYFSIDRISLSPLYWVNKGMIRHCIRKTIQESKELIYITDQFEKYYFKVLGKHGKVITTPYYQKAMVAFDNRKENTEPMVISYIGNISLKRWETLIELGKVLSILNKDNNKLVLNIYSQSTDKEIINRLSDGKSMFFKGALTTEEVYEIMEESDFLLHVESFDKIEAKRVRFSLSTKIADYLASNKPIIAIGLEGTASIDYLKENGAAFVFTDLYTLSDKLNRILEKKLQIEVVNNAQRICDSNHNMEKNSLKLKTILETIKGGKNV